MGTEYFSPINPYSKIFSSPFAERTEKKSEIGQFSELFMSMFSSSSLGGDSESGNATSLNTMMMPLMLRLLEKIQSVQIETEAGSDPDSVKMPVTGAELSQEYNAGHHGLDFSVVEGTPVRSTMTGNVVYSGWNDQGYGNLVIVENGNRRTYYAHLSELPVFKGERINQGDVIGLSGNTGNSTGPHLHYEIRINGQAIDPSEEVFSGNNPAV
jgi:murein DD-endopeptidase MepM/ murein hydrolase activator NlpD